MKKHFPPGDKLHKILNKNSVKLSYSCMSNLKATIDGHNETVLQNTPPPKAKLCNCLKKQNCPIRGACLTESVLYDAKISCTTKKRIYETTLKKCDARNRKKSFNTEKDKNDTKLSTEYWKLANKKLHPGISWSIKDKYKSYNPNSRRCSLCLNEKLEIVDDPDEILLKKRSEVISQCRHRNKYKLKTLVTNKKDCGIT